MILLAMESVMLYLEQELEKRGWKQADLARYANMDTGMVSNIMSGKRNIGPTTGVSIAQALIKRQNIAVSRPSLLVDLDASGHNHGGIHQVYRVLRAFLNWYAREEELQDWQSPLRNIKPPRLSVTPLKPIDMRDLSKMLAVCPDDLCGLRDMAIMLFLLDSGVRAAELLALNLEDCDPVQGDVQVKSGKGRKTRSVAIGRKARKSLRQYLKLRVDDCDALWVTDDGHRLSYKGLLQMLGRRGLKAGVARPTPHDFRRAFALNCLRNGMDVYSLQRLMGHADLQVLRRYLAQTDDDLREAHAKASPVDNWL